MTRRPTLVVVSGPAGVGKTTLAHRLADAIGCPAICRDEIKEGLLHGVADYEPAAGDDLTVRASKLFFSVVTTLVEHGVTLVAEAAFQDKVWRPNLAPLLDVARVRIVQCRTDADTALDRTAQRGLRPAHADATIRRDHYESFQRVDLDVPTVDVDTTSGYEPPLADIVAFAGD